MLQTGAEVRFVSAGAGGQTLDALGSAWWLPSLSQVVEVCGGERGRGAAAVDREVERAQESSAGEGLAKLAPVYRGAADEMHEPRLIPLRTLFCLKWFEQNKDKLKSRTVCVVFAETTHMATEEY